MIVEAGPSFGRKEKELQLFSLFSKKEVLAFHERSQSLREHSFLVGPEASRADACMSVVAVLRQSYYLVVDLQSKAAIRASSVVIVFSQLSLDPAMQTV